MWGAALRNEVSSVGGELKSDEAVTSEVADAQHALALSRIRVDDLNLRVLAAFGDGDVFSIWAESDGGDGVGLVAGEEEFLGV